MISTRPLTALGLTLAVVIGASGCGGGGDDDASPTPTPSVTEEASPEATPTEDGPPTEEPSEEPSAEPEEPPAGVIPGAVTDVEAGPGGGSGEIAVHWTAVPDATAYRVYRATAAGGPFVAAAEIDVASGGDNPLVPGVMIWAPPADGGAQTYEYIEVAPGTVWFRVTALGPGGEGPASAVVSGEPL